MDEDTTFSRFTVGLDVGDRHSHFCVLDATGEVLEEGRVASTATGLADGFARWPASQVVMEVGTHSPWMSRQLEAAGYRVLVANSYEVGKLYKGQDKTDRLEHLRI